MNRISFRNIHIKILAVVLLVIVAMSASGTSGTVSFARSSMSDLEEEQKKLDQAIEDAQKELETKESDIAQRQLEMLDIDARANELTTKLLDLENKILVKEGEIETTTLNLEQTRQEQEEYYRLTKERIKIMYEYGSTEYLEVLLESKSTSDFFNRLEYLNKLVEYDQDMLDRIESIKLTIEEHEANLRVEKLELDALRDENTQKLNEAEALKAQKVAEVERIENDKALLKEQIEAWNVAKDEVNNQIEELIALYADQDLVFGNGELDWPLPGWTRISSDFGPRIHPVYGYASSHDGIDIPASYGTEVHVAASGRVIFAGWGNAYGNYILVDHGVDDNGNHIVTHYAHNSQLLVSEGDFVIRGDVIAKVGSTGWSTGNHLHFGLKIGGTWVNPLSKAGQ